eukprot:9896812-Heterocapsa_arctica.AAC.1
MLQRAFVVHKDDLLKVAVGNGVCLVAVLLELKVKEQEVRTPGQELAGLGLLVYDDRKLSCRLVFRDFVHR